MSVASQCRRQAQSIALLAKCPACYHNVRHRSILSRYLQTESQPTTPLRKQFKDEAKRKKRSSPSVSPQSSPQHHAYELTVGIEVHARLNTASKLFSSAPTTASDVPNTHVAVFDAALPGAQPHFQTAALIPAIRAALALNCTVKHRSSWDRKHYFYQDQPNGYQITQYYEPFAVNGTLNLAEGEIGIKQVQLEQDTAKTTQHPGSETYMIDYSRVGAPLIEIITLPQIHTPQAAAETVRRIRDLLRAVDACSGNMDRGDLRADVNVSVRRRDGPAGSQSYAGVQGLGTRTEIKNLNSFRSVEEAVAAERDRQIKVLEGGGKVVGETRGWTIGGTETTRLRSKEGEVDYRYMPDPDLGPVFIDEKLVEDLRRGMPEPPEKVVERIMADSDLSIKDATTLLTLDDGERLEFAAETMELVLAGLADTSVDRKKVAKTAANWTLHEIGGLLASGTQQWEDLLVTSQNLADIISNLLQRHITGRSAKQLLQAIFDGTSEGKSVDQLIEDGSMRLRPMSDDEYAAFAQTIIDENPDAVAAIQKGQKGKVMFFVGQMMRRADEGTVEADKAKQVIEQLLGL